MNSRIWIRKALSMCLMVALYATYSMVTLASTKVVGELSVSGKAADGEVPMVLVNGETAQSGRSIFSSSTITTPESATAIINVAKVGKVEVAPNTTLVVSFNEKGLSGDLLAGKVTVLAASENIDIKTPDGKIASLSAGESAVAGNARQDDTTDSDGGGAWVWWTIVAAAAGGLIIYGVTRDNNNITLGGGGVVVSRNQ